MVAMWGMPAGATHPGANHENMKLLDFRPTPQTCNPLIVGQNPQDRPCTTSDIAFHENLAVVGDYGGARIFDISDPADPVRISRIRCWGPQNDPTVWEAPSGRLTLVLSVDVTQTRARCGSTFAGHDNPNGWEGLRIFDITDPANPQFIGAVYQDCGSHTNTGVPINERVVLIYNQSYPLRPGPTCGPVRGPEAGRDPLHGVIQVVRLPLENPKGAQEIAEPPVVYPGDADNMFDPCEHGLCAPFIPMRACHDVGVILGASVEGVSQPGDLGLAGAACAEQAQLWRILPSGLPDSGNPIWVYDDNVDETGITGEAEDPGVAVDFWHSATFTWDGEVINFIDESFGSGCPTTTPAFGADTGRMFFLDVETGALLSQFMQPREEGTGYCSAHLGNFVATDDAYLLANAWYTGGADVIDATDPTNPVETAFWDFTDPTSDNWSHYWYEGPCLRTKTNGDCGPAGAFPTYGTDLAKYGFETFRVFNQVPTNRVRLDELNPQTQTLLFP